MPEKVSRALESELSKMSLSDMKILKDELSGRLQRMRETGHKDTTGYKDRAALLEIVSQEIVTRIQYLLVIREEEKGDF